MCAVGMVLDAHAIVVIGVDTDLRCHPKVQAGLLENVSSPSPPAIAFLFTEDVGFFAIKSHKLKFTVCRTNPCTGAKYLLRPRTVYQICMPT